MLTVKVLQAHSCMAAVAKGKWTLSSLDLACIHSPQSLLFPIVFCPVCFTQSCYLSAMEL